jgi:two-component system LytT family response regulator
VKAFELNAIDYLLKPVDPARLAAAVERLPGLRRAEAPRRPAAGILDASDKVFVREGEKCWFVEVGQIRLLESEGNYTRVHFGDAQPQLFRSLNAMEERLDPKFFFRANRRQIINISWIAGIEPWFSSGLLVQLKGGAKVELSRRQAQEFRERMSL